GRQREAVLAKNRGRAATNSAARVSCSSDDQEESDRTDVIFRCPPAAELAAGWRGRRPDRGCHRATDDRKCLRASSKAAIPCALQSRRLECERYRWRFVRPASA